MRAIAAIVLILATGPALLAQADAVLQFRFDLGFAGGVAVHETESSPLDDDTGGAFTRIRFEGVSERGFGGGLRFEQWVSDDDLFQGAFPATEATSSSFYAHFTYRMHDGDFTMPMRIGLLFNNYVLEEVVAPVEVEADTVAILFEVAPEIVVSRGATVTWSLYGELGLGGGSTEITATATPGTFDSTASVWTLEAGTRLRFDIGEVGLAYVNHGVAFDESDPVGASFIRGFGGAFHGVMLTVGIVF